MKASNDFYSGTRYAIFGAKAPGRAQGPIAIKALLKAGKTPIAIEADGSAIKNAEVKRTLAEAGSVDGAIILPPTPWNDAFMTDAIHQCQATNTPMWIYTDKADAKAEAALSSANADAVLGKCPCLYITGCGFPHNLHQWLAKVSKQL